MGKRNLFIQGSYITTFESVIAMCFKMLVIFSPKTEMYIIIQNFRLLFLLSQTAIKIRSGSLVSLLSKTTYKKICIYFMKM